MTVKNAMNTDNVLQSITDVELVRRGLYVIRFSDDSSIDVYFSEGNAYVMSRDYKNSDDVAARIGVLQLNLIWYHIMQLRWSQQQLQRAN